MFRLTAYCLPLTAVFLTAYGLPLTAVFAEEEPVAVSADQVEYFAHPKKVVARGGVTAVHRETKLTCDFATIYTETQDAYLKGRVRLVQPGGLLQGEEVVYNFRTRKGVVLDSESQSGAWRSVGDEGKKLGEEAFLQRRGYLTSCDFEEPHTRWDAKEVYVYLDDRVVLKRVVMRVGSVPVLYLPSYTHSLDDKRPRVTIIPGKEDDWGLFLLTAWRLYLHENLQGRVHVDYRERLDLASGVDLKYQIPDYGRGIFRSYYTHERAIGRDHLWSRWYNAKENRQITRERERHRFQLRHRWEVDKATQAILEVHRAQDESFVKDFFLREFEQDAAPLSFFQLIRSDPWYSLTFLIKKRINRFETVTQEFPSVNFRIRPLLLSWLPSLEKKPETLEALEQVEVVKEAEAGEAKDRAGLRAGVSRSGWYYQSSFDYLHSNVAEKTVGTEKSLVRFNTLQELFYPLRLFKWLNLRPFASFQHTADSRGEKEDAPQFRQAGAVGADVSTKLSRVFDLTTNWGNLDINRLRHIITPTLSYRYQGKPTISADKLLRSDGLTKGNLATFGLEHKLQTKRGSGPSPAIVDLARFQTSLPYNLEGSSGRGGKWDNFSLDLETKPYGWLYLESDAQLDPQIFKFLTINADLIVQGGSWALGSSPRIGQMVGEDGALEELPWALGLGWRYQRNTSAQMTLETEFDLSKKWRVGIYQAFDVKRFVKEETVLASRDVKKIYDFAETEYRLRRDLHEWTVELIFNKRRSQGEALMLVFRLKAAPETPLEVERSYHQPKSGRNSPKR
ncbi:MAG: hypothetical protein HYS41_05270 [Candidatus Omnitrophica bacterium]|nr:hypothetical protein [Candidatus Omnitrophota bacterium]